MIKPKIIFLIGSSQIPFIVLLAAVSEGFRLKSVFELSNLIVFIVGVVSAYVVWHVARNELILRKRSEAIASFMDSNRKLNKPLTDLFKIVNFEYQDIALYYRGNSSHLNNRLGEVHDELRKLIIERTQIWEEHRIAVMPTENYHLFITYLLDEIRDDLFNILNNSKIRSAEQAADLEYARVLNGFFEPIVSKLLDSIVFLLDFGNLLQNEYLSKIFNQSVPKRRPADGSQILEQFDVDLYVINFQNDRDKYFLKNEGEMPRFSNYYRTAKPFKQITK